MKTVHINEITAEQFRKLAAIAREAEEKVQELLVSAVRADIPEDAKMKVLDWIKRAETFRGLSYFLTPQPEWTGGDSSDPKNFKIRAPHICA